MQRGDGVKGPSAPSRELEVGFDIIGPLVESPDGNVYKFGGYVPPLVWGTVEVCLTNRQLLY